MDFDTVAASHYPLPDLVELLNQGFEDYFVPIQFDTVGFLQMLRKDGIDLTASQVLIAEEDPCGIALIARRGWTSRLAAMGIAKANRGEGAGSWFMERLIEQACQREEHEMCLEVIEQNEAAVKLYRKSGFHIVRRLIGLIRKQAKENRLETLHEIDLRQMGSLIIQHGWPDLPWQLSGESLAQMNPPARAFCKEQAYIAISNPALEHIVIWSLLVEKEARGHGLGTELLKNILAQYSGRTWHVPAIFPEEFQHVFERAGFEKEALSQWQMKRSL